ncbi:MAG: alginate export family protein [Nitrospira sp.]|nr:alginate export family protein [Nitrospira sp.]
MKGWNHTSTWVIVAVLFTAVIPVYAEKTTPATDKNSAVPAVPRAIPDLIPYHKFDPSTSMLFDINKLTISGDLRVRPEFRTNWKFGRPYYLDGAVIDEKSNSFFVQQWARLGFNYSISPDVTFFFQPQYSKNWGVNNTVDANGTGGTLFARQAFMLVRNFLVPNLTVKAGRQLVVWGNHRMFGHFDWNNVGWSHDGLTAELKLSNTATLEVGWLRTEERNCTGPTTGNCIGGTQVPGVNATSDADIVYVRTPMNVGGLVLEPTYIWHNGGTNEGLRIEDARPANQSRHTIGGRAFKRGKVGSGVMDATIEGYYQFGEIGGWNDPRGRHMDISAYAFHIDAGFTLPVSMQPRLGAEFNTASGQKNSNTCRALQDLNDPMDAAQCPSAWSGFDQLYPTNHIHFGYMDLMSWKNMKHISFGLQLRPTKDSHFEITGHKFYLNELTDHWYFANQGYAAFQDTLHGNDTNDLGSEVDVVYTHFFTPGNHVAWQTGAGVFMPGEFIDRNAVVGGDAVTQTWGYTQLWINF